MGALICSRNWSQTPLGPSDTWPQSLKTGIQIILGSRHPMFIWWGQRLSNFYNDAYIPFCRATGERCRTTARHCETTGEYCQRADRLK